MQTSVSNSGIDDTLEVALKGERVSPENGNRLFESKDLLSLGMTADAVRRALHPEDIVTFVIDRNINYTNLCVSGCKFCAFFRKPGDPDGYVISQEELDQKIAETVACGGTQILMQGGLHPDLPLEFYEDLLRHIRAKFNIHLHCFSPPEIIHFARLNGLSIEEVIGRLHAAGLDTIPGGGAEILVDRVREQVSPKKCTTTEWLDVMRTAHKLGMKTTATMMFGHVETYADRVEHLERIRSLQDETGGFTAFIPWPFQPGNTTLPMRTVGGFEYLKTLAISRLYLDNIPNIQASWVTQGPKIAQLALRFGANDMGSTMLEENVVRAAGVEFRMSPDELKRLIKDAGFEARQRDCYYQTIE